MENKTDIINAVQKVIETVHRLRAPGGCPWDREQTHGSLRPYLIEEAYEALDILDQLEKVADPTQKKDLLHKLKKELGDVLLQILLHAEIGAEEKAFHLGDVALALNEKLIHRHPHVFGEAEASTSNEVLKNWEKLKAKEKKKDDDPSVLAGVPGQLPALLKAFRVIEKVSRVGFQWPSVQGALQKLDEEVMELKNAKTTEAQEDELGDVLFTVCCVSHFLKVEPEAALRRSLAKFEKRFRFIEENLARQGKAPGESTLSEMDRLWNEAKASIG